MNRLTLTESDLATIENALLNAAKQCREDAEAFPVLAAASTESADKYEALAEKIAEADRITVERLP
jgi:hypothetical protein